MMGEFQDQLVIVTGAASGIGRAIALAYLDQGACVLMVDARPEALEALYEGLDGAGRSRSRVIGVDVREPAQVLGAMQYARQWHGPANILVNAAGLYPSVPFVDMEEADWDRVLDTNLKGPFLMSQAFAKALIQESHSGVVVNITSGAAYRARPGAAHYATSKAGLVMLTQAMALELAPYGIRVNAVSPGFVRVDSAVNPLSPGYVEAITQTIPLGRVGRPEDIAEAVLFLSSQRSKWTTGSILRVDGGSGTGTNQLPLSRDPNSDGGGKR